MYRLYILQTPTPRKKEENKKNSRPFFGTYLSLVCYQIDHVKSNDIFRPLDYTLTRSKNVVGHDPIYINAKHSTHVIDL